METTTLMRIDPGRDPSLLRDYLEAHFAHQRACGARELLVHALAGLGLLVWLAAARPTLLGDRLGPAVLAAWAVAAVATVAACLAEARWRRRAAQLRLRAGG